MTNRQLREGARCILEGDRREAGHPPSHRFEEARDAHDLHHADEIVGQRRQAEFGLYLLQPAQEKGTLVHPLLDATERVLGDFAPLLQNLGVGPLAVPSTVYPHLRRKLTHQNHSSSLILICRHDEQA
jgi:hypothetical protein